MIYNALADLIVAFHFAFVGFVVIGQLLIWIGVARHRRWVRSPAFRISHLVAILIVGLEAVGRLDCPLTVWEAQLRQSAGNTVEESSFLGRWLHAAIFVDVDPAVLNSIHICFALLVLATFILWPPTVRSRVRSP
jgi:hypothetical protein